MLQYLNEKEWDYILEDNMFGSGFEYAILVDRDLTEQEKNDFRATQIMVKLKQEKETDPEYYLIFDNTGLINVIKDYKILSENSSEYDVFRFFPELSLLSMQFISYMSDKYGLAYIQEKLPQTEETMTELAHKKSICNTEIKKLDFMENYQKQFKKGLSKQEKEEIQKDIKMRMQIANEYFREIQLITSFMTYQNQVVELLKDNLAILTQDDDFKTLK